MEFLGKITGHYFQKVADEKDKDGWENENVQKLREIYAEWEVSTISDGRTETSAGRVWLRQIFDCICCCGEVEGKYTDERIKLFLEIAKKKGLL